MKIKVKNQIQGVIILTGLAFLISTSILIYGYLIDTPIEHMSNLADVSMAVSSIFVLVIGIISITLVASVETSDYRNSEKVKEDMMQLTAALFSISHKFNRSANKDRRTLNEWIEEELKVADQFFRGPTFLAMQVALRNNEEKRDLVYIMGERILTLDENPGFAITILKDLDSIVGDEKLVDQVVTAMSDSASFLHHVFHTSEYERITKDNK